MFAFKESNNLALYKIFEANAAIFVGVSDFHFLDLIDFDAHAIKLFL